MTPDEDESEIQIFKCDKLISENNLKNQLEKMAYGDIFGTLPKQIQAAKSGKKL